MRNQRLDHLLSKERVNSFIKESLADFERSNGFSLGLLKFVVVNIKRSCLKATERFMCDSGIAYGSYVRIKAFKLICGNNSG